MVVFLLGDLLVRRSLRLGLIWPRGIAALVAVASVAIGARVSITAELAVIVLALLGAFTVEKRSAAQSAARSAEK